MKQVLKQPKTAFRVRPGALIVGTERSCFKRQSWSSCTEETRASDSPCVLAEIKHRGREFLASKLMPAASRLLVIAVVVAVVGVVLVVFVTVVVPDFVLVIGARCFVLFCFCKGWVGGPFPNSATKTCLKHGQTKTKQNRFKPGGSVG